MKIEISLQDYIAMPGEDSHGFCKPQLPPFWESTSHFEGVTSYIRLPGIWCDASHALLTIIIWVLRFTPYKRLKKNRLIFFEKQSYWSYDFLHTWKISYDQSQTQYNFFTREEINRIGFSRHFISLVSVNTNMALPWRIFLNVERRI